VRKDQSRLVMTGADCKDLLHRLTTNDVHALAPGRGCRTLLLERSGRLVDSLQVADRGGDLILRGTGVRASAVREAIDRFTILEDARLEDATDATREIFVAGPQAASAVEHATGAPASTLPPYGCAGGTGDAREATVLRVQDHGEPAFAIVAPHALAERIAGRLAPAPRADEAWLHALRVFAGVPAWGAEIDERTIPLEARLVDAISFTKGCYVGQEVIARLHHQKRVKRSLVRISIAGSAPLDSAAQIEQDARSVGRITSSALSGGRCVALGFVDAAWDAPGTKLDVVAGGTRRSAEVLTLHPEGDPRWRT
jgi:folate-binding protein YgfZ